MFSVFDKHLLTDMGKTIVRKYMHTTDAQSVWKDFQEHMKSSSKGASEKRRLAQYVTKIVLDDNYKGTTEHFVVHFNEQLSNLKKSPKSLNIFHHKSNYNYSKMQLDQSMI